MSGGGKRQKKKKKKLSVKIFLEGDSTVQEELWGKKFPWRGRVVWRLCCRVTAGVWSSRGAAAGVFVPGSSDHSGALHPAWWEQPRREQEGQRGGPGDGKKKEREEMPRNVLSNFSVCGSFLQAANKHFQNFFFGHFISETAVNRFWWFMAVFDF